MHAFLIVGDNPKELELKIQKISGEKTESLLQFSIEKIEKTRELTKFLALTQPPGTTILIKDVDTSSAESLNAFLKNLEEPNENITFILTARSEFGVLPTILSRCQIIKLRNSEVDVNETSQKFINAGAGEKLEIIEKIKKREEAQEFVKNLLYALHKSLFWEKPDLEKTGKLLKISQETLDALNQNGNVTMQLTNMVVKMNKSAGLRPPDAI